MTKATVAADVHQALNAHSNFAAQVTLYLDVVLNDGIELTNFQLGNTQLPTG